MLLAFILTRKKLVSETLNYSKWYIVEVLFTCKVHRKQMGINLTDVMRNSTATIESIPNIILTAT